MKSSLDENMQNVMDLEASAYTVQGTVISALFYKVLIGKAEVGTQATIALTRNTLTRLDQKMLELDSDISKFNEFVLSCKRKLNSRGASSSDLLINLFNGYKAAQDADFVDTISKIEKDYLHGITPDLSDSSLMAKAMTAYQVRVESNTWGALSADREMIVAMQAKVDELKDARLKVDTRSRDKKKRK